MKIYEGLFLVNNSEARKDMDAVCQRVEGIITKYGGEIQRNERWGERKLAYPVKRRDRGAYILVYFHAPPESIVQIKHDCVIDEVIMRNMILRINAIPEQKAKPEEVKVPEAKPEKVEVPGEEPAKEGQPEEQAAQAVEQDVIETEQVTPSEEEDAAVSEVPVEEKSEPAQQPEEEPVAVVEAEPVEAEPVEAEPVEAEPVEAEPVEAEPVEAEPVEEPADKEVDQAGEAT